MSEFKWTDKMEALAQKHYSPEQLRELRARPFDAEDQARVGAAWEAVYRDLDALGAGADPASLEALAIGRRARALIEEFTQGDPARFKAAGAMKREMMSDPALSGATPARQASFALLGRIFAALRDREEMSFEGAV